jgi:hypothetical protein
VIQSKMTAAAAAAAARDVITLAEAILVICRLHENAGAYTHQLLLCSPACLEPPSNHEPRALDVFVIHRAIDLAAAANVCVIMVVLLLSKHLLLRLLLLCVLLLLMPALVVLLLRDSMAAAEDCQHAILRISGSGELLVHCLCIGALHFADNCGLGVSTLQGRASSAVLSRAAATQAHALQQACMD